MKFVELTMVARIYRPAKNAMQSGRANSKTWILEYEPQSRRTIDPLMGWTSSADTLAQLKLRFGSKDECIAFAKKNGIPYEVHEPHERKLKIKTYADNFR
jgi:hypothetical protein